MNEQIEIHIRKWHKIMTNTERVMDQINDVFGNISDSPFADAIWTLMGEYTTSVERECSAEGWLVWWWTTCQLGVAPKDASPAGGQLRTIATIEDLIALINEDNV